MAFQEFRTLLRMDGDPTGAVSAIQTVESNATAMGATMVKVTEQINTGAERRAATAMQRISNLSTDRGGLERIRTAQLRQIRQLSAEWATASQQQVAANQRVQASEQRVEEIRRAAIVSQRRYTDEIIKAQRAQSSAREAASARNKAQATATKELTANQTAEERIKQQIIATDQKALALLRKGKEQTDEYAAAVLKSTELSKKLVTVQEQRIALEKQEAEALKAQEAAQKALDAAEAKVQKLQDDSRRVKNNDADYLAKAEKELKTAREQAAAAATHLRQVEGQLGTTRRQLDATDRALKTNTEQQTKAQDKYITATERIITATYKFATAVKSQVQSQKEAGTAFGKSIQDFESAGRATGDLVTALTKLGRVLGSDVNSNTLKTVQASRQLLTMFTSLLRATGDLGKGMAHLVQSGGQALGKLKELTSQSGLVGHAFALTGNQMSGIAVKLQGAQVGLMGAGSLFTQLASKGREAFTDLITLAGDFEQKMVTLAAIANEKLGSQLVGQLRQMALDLGKATMFGPGEASDVMSELVKGGFNPKDTNFLKDLSKDVLDLSAATGEKLDTSVQAVISSQQIWNSTGITGVEIVNNLTRAANASSTSVDELAGGIKNVGGAAATLGISQKETLVGLSVLANAGLRGPQGGTALRYFFLNLIPSTQKAIELMEEYKLLVFDTDKAQKQLAQSGVAFENTQQGTVQGLWEMYTQSKTDFQEAIDNDDPLVSKFQQWMVRQGFMQSQFVDTATGKMKDFASIMDIMHNTFGGLDEVEQMSVQRALFGERGGSKAGAALMLADEQHRKENGPNANLARDTAAEMDTLGSASDIGKERMKGFAGSLENLNSTIEALKINLGTPLLEPLAGLLQMITQLLNQLDSFGQANPQMLQMAGTLMAVATGFAAVVGPLLILAASWPFLVSGFMGLVTAAAPIGAILSVVAAAFYGIYQLVQDPSSGLMPALQQLADAFGRMLPEAAQAASEVFNQLIAPLGQTIGAGIMDYAIPALEALIGMVPDLIRGFGGFIADTILPMIHQLANGFLVIIIPAVRALIGVLPQLRAGFAAMHAILRPVITTIVNGLAIVLPMAIRLAVQLFNQWLLPVMRTLGDIISTVVVPLIIRIGQSLPPIIALVGKFWSEFLGPALSLALGLLGNLVAQVMDLWDSLSKWLFPALQFLWQVLAPVVQGALVGIWGVITLLVQGLKLISDAIGGVFDFVGDLLGLRQQTEQAGKDATEGLKDGLSGMKQVGTDSGRAFGSGLSQGLDAASGQATGAMDDLMGSLAPSGMEQQGASAANFFITGMDTELRNPQHAETIRKAGQDLTWLLSSPEVTQSAASTAVDRYTAQAEAQAHQETAKKTMERAGETLAENLTTDPVKEKARQKGAELVGAAAEGAREAAGNPEFQGAMQAVGAQATEIMSVEFAKGGPGMAQGIYVTFKDAAGTVKQQLIPVYSETGQKIIKEGLLGPEVGQAIDAGAVDLLHRFATQGSATLNADEHDVLLPAILDMIRNGTAGPEVMAEVDKQAFQVMNDYVYNSSRTLSSDEMKLIMAAAGVDNLAALKDNTEIQHTLDANGQHWAASIVTQFAIEANRRAPDLMNASTSLAASADNQDARAAAERAGRNLGETVRYYYAQSIAGLQAEAQQAIEAAQEAVDLRDVKAAAYAANARANNPGMQSGTRPDDERADLRAVTKSAQATWARNAPKQEAPSKPKGNGPAPVQPKATGLQPTPYSQGGGGGSKGGGSSNEKSAAEKAADLVKNTADAIAKGIEAFQKLSGMVVPANVGQKAKEFADAAAVVVMQLQRVAQQFQSKDDSVLNHVSTFAETASKVMDLIGKGVEAFRKLADFKAPLTSRVAEFVVAIQDVVAQFQAAAGHFKQDALVFTGEFADAAGKVVDLIGKGVDAFDKLQDFIAPATSSIRAVVDAVQETMTYLAPLASAWGPAALDASAAYADAAGKVTDNLSKATDFFVKLNTLETTLDGATRKAQIVLTQSNTLLEQVRVLAAGWDSKRTDSTAAYADAAGKTADNLSKAADFFSKLTDPKLRLTVPRNVIKELVAQSQVMMGQLAALVADKPGAPGWNVKNTAKVGEFATHVGQVADNLDKVMSFLDKLVKSKTSFKDLRTRVEELVNATQHMMNYLGPLTARWKGFTEQVSTFAQTSGTVADGLLKSMDLLDKLGKSKTNWKDLAGRVQELTNATADIMARVAAATPKDFEVGAIPEFTDTVGKVADALTKTIDLLDKLGHAKKLGDASQAYALEQQMVAIIRGYQNVLISAGIALDDTSSEAQALAGSIAESQSKIISTLGSAFDLLTKLDAYVKPRGANPNGALVNLMTFLLNMVGQFAAAREQFAARIDAETAQLAEDVGKAVGGLSSALELFIKLGDYRGVSVAQVNGFIDTLRLTVQRLRDGLLNEVSDDMLDLAQAFGEKLGPAFDLLGKALELFKAITGSKDDQGKTTGGLLPVDINAIEAFVQYTKYLIQRLRDGLLNEIAPEMLDLAQEFGQKLGPAIDVLDKSLGIFLKLAGDGKDQKGLKDNLAGAVGALVYDVYVMLHHWNNVIQGGEFQGDFATRSEAFAQTVAGVVDSIQKVLDLINNIGESGKKGGALTRLPELMTAIGQAMSQLMNITVPQTQGNLTQQLQQMAGATTSGMADVAGGMNQGLAAIGQDMAEQSKWKQEGTLLWHWGMQVLGVMLNLVIGKNGLQVQLRVAFTTMMQQVSGVIEEGAPGMAQTWNSAMQSMAAQTQAAVGQIRAAIASINGASVNVSVSASMPAGASPGTAPGGGVPAMASGGIATKPTFAYIGEGGEPEAVVPLSKAKSLGFGGGNGQTVNNHYNIRQVNVRKTSDLAQQTRRERALATDPS